MNILLLLQVKDKLYTVYGNIVQINKFLKIKRVSIIWGEVGCICFSTQTVVIEIADRLFGIGLILSLIGI